MLMYRSAILLIVTGLSGILGWLNQTDRPADPLAFLTTVSASQNVPVGHADYIPICGLTHIGGIPITLLQQRITLRTDIGTYPTPTSSQSPEAQAFFEQGMAYLNGYSLVEAARSFHQALHLDSTLAMAHVGLSRVYSQLDDTTAAYREADQARKLGKYASERERAHIKLRFSQLKALDSLNSTKLLMAYRRDIEQAVRQFQKDADLWLLLGNAQERYANGRGQGSSSAGIAIYEKVLHMAPDHPAAHHFLIHANEGMMNFQQALIHGEAYARLSPNLPHARHMYAHDLMKTNQLDKAVFELTKADNQEQDLYKSDRYKPDYDWHHAHNLNMLALCYRYLGQINDAEQTIRRTYTLTTPGRPHWSFYTKRSYPDLLVSLGRTVDAQPLATAMSQAAVPAERLMGHYLLGLLHLQQHDLAKATSELEASKAELATLRKVLPNDRALLWTEPYPRFLSALIRLTSIGKSKEQRQEQSTATLDSVRAFQKTALDQYGPDPWVEALFQLETIARVAQQQNLDAFADESVKRLAEHDPNYPGTHYLLAQMARRHGDEATAKRELTLAQQGWAKADPSFKRGVALR